MDLREFAKKRREDPLYGNSNRYRNYIANQINSINDDINEYRNEVGTLYTRVGDREKYYSEGDGAAGASGGQYRGDYQSYVESVNSYKTNTSTKSAGIREKLNKYGRYMDADTVASITSMLDDNDANVSSIYDGALGEREYFGQFTDEWDFVNKRNQASDYKDSLNYDLESGRTRLDAMEQYITSSRDTGYNSVSDELWAEYGGKPLGRAATVDDLAKLYEEEKADFDKALAYQEPDFIYDDPDFKKHYSTGLQADDNFVESVEATHMSRPQLDYYFYLRGKYGGKAAMDYKNVLMQYGLSDKIAEDEEKKNEEIRAWANDNKLLAAVTSPLRGVGGALHAFSVAPLGQADDVARDHSNKNSQITAGITQGMSEFGAWATELGISAWDNIALGRNPVTRLLRAGSTMTYAAGDALNRGVDEERAVGFGVFSALSELIGDKIGGQLFPGGEKATIGKKGFMRALLSKIGKGFAEEATTEVLNIAYDTIVNGKDAEYSWEELKNNPDLIKEIGARVLGAGLGGAVFGTTFGSMDIRKANKIANESYKSEYGGVQSELVSEGLSAPTDSRAYKLAQKNQAKLEKGKNLSGKKIRYQVNANESAFRAGDVSAIKGAVAQTLQKYGETDDVDAISSAIAKEVSGEKLTRAEDNLIKSSLYGERVRNELNAENIKSGEYTSDWNANLGTQRIGADVYNRGAEYGNFKADNGITEVAANLATGETGLNTTVELDDVSRAASPMAKSVTGIDTTGFKITMSGNALNSLITQNPKTGAIDAAKVDFVLSNPDSVTVADASAEGGNANTFAYEKNIGDGRVYAATVAIDPNTQTVNVLSASIADEGSETADIASGSAIKADAAKSPSVFKSEIGDASTVQASETGFVEYNKDGSVKTATPTIDGKITRTEAAERRARTSGKTATVADYAAFYGDQAKTFETAYKLGDSANDIGAFARDYETAYNWGKIGIGPSHITSEAAVSATPALTDSQREIAYRAGTDALASQVGADGAGIRSMTSVGGTAHKKGTLRGHGVKVHDVKKAFSGDSRRDVVSYLRTFAEATGINIVLYKSTTDANGNLVGTVIDGVDLTDSQGGFAWHNNTIYIDINAGHLKGDTLGDIRKYSLLRTFAHEFTHFCEKWNPEAYNDFRSLVFEHLQSKGEDPHALVLAKQGKTGLGYEAASREVIADAMTDILPETSFLDKLFKKNRELFDKLHSQLKKYLRSIKSYFAKLYGNDDAAANALKEDIGGTVRYIEDIVKAFDELATTAVENYQAASETAAESTAAERAEEIVFGESKAEDSNISMGVSKQLREHKAIGEKAIKYNSSHMNVSEAVLEVGVEAMNEMAEAMLPYLDKDGILPPDNPGKTIFKNGSYGRSGENTTLCVRTLTYEDFKNRVAEKVGRPLTVAESLLVSQKIYDIATDPQCIYCYVAADRKAYDEYLGAYQKSMDKYIKALRAGGDYNKLYNEYLDGRKDTSVQQKRFAMWNKIAKSGAQYISAKDLISKASRDATINKGGAFAAQVRDAQRYAQSASWAKKVEDYRAYNGEILRMTQTLIDTLNSEYGLRMYSFSDYTPAFIVENMQMIIDASVRGLKSLAYTKDTDYAEIFAPTGQAINVSCFARFERASGTYVEDSRQGANWAKTKSLRMQYRNVGAVMVATNDAMVEWALKQDWIDIVVPYHIVKTGTTIANEYDWNNYTADSADKAGNKAATIYPTEHNNDFATFKKLIAERGLTPRFEKWFNMVSEGKLTEAQYMKLVNEVRLPASELGKLSPNFNLEAAKRSFGIDETGEVIPGGFVDKGGYMGGWYRAGIDADAEADIVAADIEAGKSSLDVEYGLSAAAKEKIAEHYKASKQVRGADIEHQKRTATLSDREVLEMAGEQISVNEGEKAALDIFNKRLGELKSLQDERARLGALWKDQQFGDGDRSEARATLNRMEALDAKIQRADASVNAAVESGTLKSVRAKARKAVREDTNAYYRAMLEKARTNRDADVADAHLAEQMHYGAKLAKERANRDAKLEKQREHFAEVREHERERREESKLREKVKGLKEKFEKMLLSPTDNTYVPLPLVQTMVDVCNLINTDTVLYKDDGSINRTQEARNQTKTALLNLADEYRKLKGDESLGDEFDEGLLEYIDTVRQNADKPLSEMGADELNELYDALRAIGETIADARKMISFGDALDIYEVGDGIVAEQKDIIKSRKNGERSKVGSAVDALDNLGLSPVRAVEKMSGYNEDSYLVQIFRKLEEGERKKNKFVMDSYAVFEPLTTGKNAKAYEAAMYNPEPKVYTDKNGRQFRVTKMQMMQAVLSLEREQANGKTNHIEKDGLTFADVDMLKRGDIKKAIDPAHSHAVVGDSALKLCESFKLALAKDAWAQEYMAAAREYFNGMAKDAVNETTLKLKHRIVAKDKNYIPFEVDQNFVKAEISDTREIQRTINSYGMLKDSQKGASNPLIMTGLNNILDRHINEVGTIYGLAVPIRDFNKVWTLKTPSTTNTVVEVVGAAWGNSGTELIRQTVKDVQSARTDKQSFIYKALKSGYITSVFTFNLSVVTKQVGSLFSAMSMLRARDPLSMLGNLAYTMAHHEEIAAEVNKYTASAWMRRQGLSDAELRTLMSERQKGLAARLLSKAPTAINPTKWITAMDYSVALSLWKYAKADVKRANPELEGDDLLKKTAEFYDSLIENTQSISDALHRPEIQKRKDVLSESVSMFKTDLFQMAGNLHMAVGRAAAHKDAESKKALGRTLYAATMNIVWSQAMTTLFALLRYSVKRYRDDEDELTAESVLKRVGFAAVSDFVGYIAPLFGSELVGFIESMVYGETGDAIENAVLSSINNLASSVYNIGASIADGEAPNFDDYRKLAFEVLSTVGVPADNANRIVNAVALHAKDIAYGEFLSFNSDPKLPKGKRLYTNAVRGDEDVLEELRATYKTEDSYRTALRSALRDNDPRIKEAAEAKAVGDFDGYEDIIDEIVGEGAFDLDLVVGAVNSEYGKLTAEEDGEDEVEKDEAVSKWSASDVGVALDSGDTARALSIIDDLVRVKMENGSTEKDAKSSVKSSLTRHYKPLYLEADDTRRASIRISMYATGLYKSADDVVDACDGWLKSDLADRFKERYKAAYADGDEALKTDIERQMRALGYFDNPVVIRKLLANWREEQRDEAREARRNS